MKASFFVGDENLEIREMDRPSIGDEDILLRVEACGVCGTDIHKVKHNLVKPPLVLGHEVAGVVAEVGSKVTKFSAGDRVVVAHHTPCYACHYCQHGNVSMCETFKKSNLDPGGFAEFLRVPSVHVQMTAHKIPESMSFDQAIYMEPLACILRNIKRAQLMYGDTVLIVGLGSVGLLTGQALIRQGMKVFGSDLKKDRCDLALSLGFSGASQANEKEIQNLIHTNTDARGVDLVVLTAGNSKVYSHAINYIRGGGKVSIFAGLEPGAKVSFDVNDVYKKEITLFSSYSPSPVELKEALDLIESKEVNVDVLKAKTYPLKALSSAIDDVSKQNVFKAIVHPPRA